MKITRPALEQLHKSSVKNGSKIIYLVCASPRCKRLRTFWSREEAELAGWHVGERHNLCPACAKLAKGAKQ